MIPERLQHLASFPGGAEWLAHLPRLVEECVAHWALDVGEAFLDSNVSYVAPAGDVVLKISFPHWESEHEPAALAHWNGDGAVRLLAHDPTRHAMLIERCRPGTSLLAVPEREAFELAVPVVAKLNQRPAPPDSPITAFADTAVRWAEELPRRWEEARRPFERALLDAAVDALVDLPGTQRELVVCSQDLHRGNVLAAEREGWLSIDPKPVLAEREFSAVALVRDAPGDLVWRLDFLSGALGLDRERLRRWTIAHTVSWGFAEHEPYVYERQIGVARELLHL